jgi:hypothetical protein
MKASAASRTIGCAGWQPLYRKKGRASISDDEQPGVSDPRSALDQMKQCAASLSNPFLQICKSATLLEQLLRNLQRRQDCQRLGIRSSGLLLQLLHAAVHEGSQIAHSTLVFVATQRETLSRNLYGYWRFHGGVKIALEQSGAVKKRARPAPLRRARPGPETTVRPGPRS